MKDGLKTFLCPQVLRRDFTESENPLKLYRVSMGTNTGLFPEPDVPTVLKVQSVNISDT